MDQAEAVVSIFSQYDLSIAKGLPMRRIFSQLRLLVFMAAMAAFFMGGKAVADPCVCDNGFMPTHTSVEVEFIRPNPPRIDTTVTGTLEGCIHGEWEGVVTWKGWLGEDINDEVEFQVWMTASWSSGAGWGYTYSTFNEDGTTTAFASVGPDSNHKDDDDPYMFYYVDDIIAYTTRTVTENTCTEYEDNSSSGGQTRTLKVQNMPICRPDEQDSDAADGDAGEDTDHDGESPSGESMGGGDVSLQDSCDDEGTDDEEDCSGSSSGGSGGTESVQPVDLINGHKVEYATDLTVMVPGRDFSLSRMYSSDPALWAGFTPGTNEKMRPGQVGANWQLKATPRMLPGKVDSTETVTAYHLFNKLNGTSAVYTLDSTTGRFLADGPGQGDLLANHDDITVNGRDYAISTLRRPGGGEADFTTGWATMADEASQTAGKYDPRMAGQVVRQRDEYGNEWTYDWESIYNRKESGATALTVPGPLKRRVRPVKIYLNGDSTSSDAVVEFDWWSDEDWDFTSPPVTTTTEVDHLFGRLHAVTVKRGSTITQRVEYSYSGEEDVDSGFTPFNVTFATVDGRLCEVRKYTKVDAGTTGFAFDTGGKYYELVWQYRYGNTITASASKSGPIISEDVVLSSQGSSKGLQLSVVFDPAQIGFYGDTNVVSTDTSLGDAAELLRSLSIHLESDDNPSDTFPETSHWFALSDLASKLIGYDSNGRVERQMINGACGCGGANGEPSYLLEYSYATSTLDSVEYLGYPDTTADPFRWRNSTAIMEYVKEGSGDLEPYRMYYHEFERFGHSKDQSSATAKFNFERMAPPKRVAEATAEIAGGEVWGATGAAPKDLKPHVGRVWGTAIERDRTRETSGVPNPNYMTVIATGTVESSSVHPWSMPYDDDSTGVVDSGDPVYEKAEIGISNAGLAYRYTYSDDSEVTGTYYETSTFSLATAPSTSRQLSSSTYSGTWGTAVRFDLPTQTKQLTGVSSTETQTGLSYGTHSTGTSGTNTYYPAVAWQKSEQSIESEAQNGPSGTNYATTYEFFNLKGQLEWTVYPDLTAEYRQYDTTDGHGQMILVARNANWGSGGRNFSASNYGTGAPNPFSAHTYAGSELVTAYDYDALGRLIETTDPVGATREIRREVRARELLAVEGFSYYLERFATITFPELVSAGVYEGPLSISWVDGAGNTLSEQSYAVSTTYASATSSVISVGDQLSRREYERGLSGALMKTHLWTDMGGLPTIGSARSLLEEQIDDTASGGWSVADRIAQQFWGSRYIDDAVARRVDTDADADWTDAETSLKYYLTDAQFSVRAIVDDTTAQVEERIDYSPYGVAEHQFGADLNGDGSVDSTDGTAYTTAYLANEPKADLNFDGIYNSSDITLFGGLYSSQSSATALPAGWVSDPTGTDAFDSPVGYDGYLFNAETEVYHVRNRVYDPELGRWMTRDPAGYADGANLYGYAKSNPIILLDPNGQKSFLYAIDGTRSRKLKTPTNTGRFWTSYTGNRKYWHGPDDVPGFDTISIANAVYKTICSDYCSEIRRCGEFTPDLVGWSRGGAIVVYLASKLLTDGCKCANSIGEPSAIPVRFIGLYDAVDMTSTMASGIISSKDVNNAYANSSQFVHVIKTDTTSGIQRIFPTLSTPNSLPFNRTNGAPTTHGDIGTSNTNNNAHDHLKAVAKAAGVPVV